MSASKGRADGRGGRGANRRIRRRKAESIRAVLSERDLNVLADLARCRLLTGRLIARLHFADGSTKTTQRKARSSLQRMSDLGAVCRLERRIGGVRAGSSGYLYGLSALGQRVLDVGGPAGGKRRRKPLEPSAMFANHILGVAELYVGLKEAQRRSASDDAAKDVELLRFDAEPAAWRPWSGLAGEQLILKPDAYVEIAVGEYEQLYFIEVDLATESLNVIERKARVYIDYWQSGQEQHANGGTFPKVLWMANSPRRVEQITERLAQLEPEAWQLFQVGLLTNWLETVLRE